MGEEERSRCWLLVSNDILIFKLLIDSESSDSIFMISYWLLLVSVWFVVCVDILRHSILISPLLKCKECVKSAWEHILALRCNIKRMFDTTITTKKNPMTDIMYTYSISVELDITYLLLCWSMGDAVDWPIRFWVLQKGISPYTKFVLLNVISKKVVDSADIRVSTFCFWVWLNCEISLINVVLSWFVVPISSVVLALFAPEIKVKKNADPSFCMSFSLTQN